MTNAEHDRIQLQERIVLKPTELLPGQIVPVVFTDGDATLLDHNTYSFEPATPAINLMKKHRIPLVLTTSKTSAEIMHLYAQIGILSPCIFENGGGIVLPQDYLSGDILTTISYICLADAALNGLDIRVEERGNSTIIRLGASIDEVRAALRTACTETGVSVEGFGDWVDRPEVMMVHANFKDDQHGTAIKKAQRALTRETQEGFLITNHGTHPDDHAAEAALQAAIEAQGFTFSRGGRFLQIFRGSDKGRAVRLMAGLFHNEFGTKICTVGIGDAQNDLPLLSACIEMGGEAFIVHNPNAKGPVSLPRDSSVQILPSELPGPQGWNVAIQGVLNKFQYN